MFIGIDRGGTSTKVEIHRDGQSERRKYGPFNISAIGEEAFARIVRHPALKNLPFFLETPNDLDGYRGEIRRLREWAEK